MLLKKAWGDLRGRKLRTALVVFSVAVAVFGVSAIKLLGEQFERGATEKYVDSHPPHLVVDTLGVPAAPREALRALDNVARVEGRVAGTARWKPPGQERDENLAIQGVVDFQSPDALDRVRLVRGAFPGPGEALFEKGTRQRYGLSVGQQVTLVGSEDERMVTISGFGENPNVPTAAVIGFASGWLPRDDAAALLKLSRDNRLLIQMGDASRATVRDTTEQRVRESLEGDEVTVVASQARDPATVPGRDILDALHAILLAFGLFAACASGLLVINTVATIVLEQRPQIGAMKAIGGTTRDVLVTYLLLALLYGALGTALGLAAGFGFAVMVDGARAAALDDPPSTLSLGADTLALVVAIGVGTSLVAALVPSWQGARVTVREALISYGLSGTFGRAPWDRLVAGVRGLSPAPLLALRNAFRRPQRALLTLVGLAVATALLVAVLATLNALSHSLQAAREALRADVLIAFDTLVEETVVDRALDEAPGVDRRELWLVTSAKVGDRSVTVSGLPPDTRMFATDTVRAGGRWLAEDSADTAVVTRRLAQRHNLRVGDPLEVATSGHATQRWTVVGIVPGAGADAFAPEGSVYAPLAAVRKLADFPEGRGNQLYVRLADSGRANVDTQARALGDRLADADLGNTPVKLYEQQDSTEHAFVAFVLLFSAMILIISLVGALGLFGTLTMNVFERRREIGVLRSVGMSTPSLLWTFLLEGGCLGLLGWGLGVILGAPASRLLVSYFGDRLIPVDYAFPVSGVVVALLAILAISALASLGPALLATRIRVAEILRYA